MIDITFRITFEAKTEDYLQGVTARYDADLMVSEHIQDSKLLLISMQALKALDTHVIVEPNYTTGEAILTYRFNDLDTALAFKLTR